MSIKSGERVRVTLPPLLVQELAEHAESVGMSLSTLINLALSWCLLHKEEALPCPVGKLKSCTSLTATTGEGSCGA